MSADVSRDQLALIRIEGMHCHKCEITIQQALARHPGVHEVEVDFPSGQASVLFDRSAVSVRQLTDAVTEAGYRVTGFTQQNPDPATHRPGDTALGQSLDPASDTSADAV
jgi:copper chaperone CopZ